jgi:carbamoyltransferase
VFVLGLNKGMTLLGKQLRYGGAALVQDGSICTAALEERISRHKWAPGFDQSYHSCLRHTRGRHGKSLDISDVDIIAISTCCETETEALSGHMFAGDPRLRSVNHHLSHAALAFYGSGFQDALVVVIDGGGNVLADRTTEKWWHFPREQHSYFIATTGGIDLLERDFDYPFATGFGELYRAFSYFLGFRSSRFASKVMALAAYGNAKRLTKNELMWEISNDGLLFPIRNNPEDPLDIVAQVANTLGIDFGDPRPEQSEILPIHCDIAAFVQSNLEEALEHRIRMLLARHNLRNICIAGGFALNCVFNGALVSKGIADKIYVPPAPGDEGQAIGNALFVCNGERPVHKHGKAVYLPSEQGPSYDINTGTVIQALKDHSLDHAYVFEPKRLSRFIAQLLNAGCTVCVFHGRSDSGLRALGNRSILGNPANDYSRTVFNQLKSREWFQPFAPSVLAEYSDQYFTIAVDSPYMSFAVPVKGDKRAQIPAVVHSDGTGRVQTVRKEEKRLLREILEDFHALSGVPLLLNTSFNRAGEPIVETPVDAVRTFSSMAVNALVLGRFVIVKTYFPQLVELGLLPREPLKDISIFEKSEWRQPEKLKRVKELLDWIRGVTGQMIFVRTGFPLYGEYLDWLKEGRKVTTIRFRKNAVEFPATYAPQLFGTADYELTRTGEKLQIDINGIKYERFGNLTAEDARRDGFRSYEEMRAALKTIYPAMKDDNWITIYSISPRSAVATTASA